MIKNGYQATYEMESEKRVSRALQQSCLCVCVKDEVGAMLRSTYMLIVVS